MKSTTRTPVTAPLLDFRVMVLAVAAILVLAVNASEARQGGAQRQVTGGQHAPATTSVQRSRGADGAVDATRTGRHGGTTTASTGIAMARVRPTRASPGRRVVSARSIERAVADGLVDKHGHRAERPRHRPLTARVARTVSSTKR